MIRSFSTKVLAAVAGASMLAITLAEPAPASAFTLASPNLGHSFAADGGQLDKVYWRRWGPGWGWHRGWGWRRGWGWGWRRPWGWGPRRHCWMSPWGWRCRW